MMVSRLSQSQSQSVWQQSECMSMTEYVAVYKCNFCECVYDFLDILEMLQDQCSLLHRIQSETAQIVQGSVNMFCRSAHSCLGLWPEHPV